MPLPSSGLLKDRNLIVDYRPIEELRPYANNARQHPRSQLKKLAASLKQFGFVNPILVDDEDTILCGHGRVEAAKMAGYTRVPTIRLEHLSDADRRAFIIADNAIAEKAGWSKSMLASELQGLVDLGYDVELTGFSTLEIDTFLSLDDTSAVDDVVEEPVDGPCLTQPGDHWVIGDHHLVCGDARSPEVYETLLSGALAELVFTDPPYNVRIAGNVSGHRHGEFLMGSGELSDAEFTQQLLRPCLRCIVRNSVPGAIAFICMDWRGGPQLLDAAEGVLHELKNLIAWVKPNAGMGAFYRSQHELIYAFKISRGEHINNFGLGKGGRHRSNVWSYAGANSFGRGRMANLEDHPTVKPKKMVADAILDCSRRGGVVLDPFAGSGTTLIAAQMTGRRGYGIELDPKFCDVILRRAQEATDVEPRLQDGRSLTEVAGERLRGTSVEEAGR